METLLYLLAIIVAGWAISARSHRAARDAMHVRDGGGTPRLVEDFDVRPRVARAWPMPRRRD